MDVSDLVEAANQRLKLARIAAAIELRGKEQRLYLRATLPPKPGHPRSYPYQQRICLNLLGTPRAVKFAEAQAKLLGAELETKSFDWSRWDYSPHRPTAETIADWVQRFEEDFWSRRERDSGREATWKNYLKVFRRLPLDRPLTSEVLRKRIKDTDEDSHHRLQTTLVLWRLAKFAQIKGWEDLIKLKGRYSPKRVNPRSLPTDETIAKVQQSVSDPGWAWIIGMLAAYGLRNHEVFKLDLSQFPNIRVEPTNKTRSSRLIYPLYPEWAERWKLGDRVLPNVQIRPGMGNSALGAKITAAFWYQDLPFTAYDLRHCFARRCFEFGIPIETAARLLGHSVDRHRETYQAWIGESSHRFAYERQINRSDRPLPP